MRRHLRAGTVITAFAMAALPALAADPVKIGMLGDYSSLLADQDGLPGVEAARMAAEDFGGSVLGRPIQIIHADHQSKADIGMTIARRWYDAEDVTAIVGISNSSVALAVQDLARERGQLSIVIGAASSDLTGPACSPTGFHWLYDTYALSHVIGQTLLKRGSRSWFFVTADYAFGQSMQRETMRVIAAAGGKVAGAVLAPQNTSDFSSYLLQAASSGADTIAFANVATDFINAVKQAHEFDLAEGRTLTGLLVFISDIHSIGLTLARGLLLTESFYWDLDDETRAWSARFTARTGKVPTQVNAGNYSAVLHYLKAVRAAGTTEAAAVADKMRELPIEDFMTHGGRARADGRVVRDLYLFKVKDPAESKGPWDLYTPIATIPGEQAFRPLSDGGCPHVR